MSIPAVLIRCSAIRHASSLARKNSCGLRCEHAAYEPDRVLKELRDTDADLRQRFALRHGDLHDPVRESPKHARSDGEIAAIGSNGAVALSVCERGDDDVVYAQSCCDAGPLLLGGRLVGIGRMELQPGARIEVVRKFLCIGDVGTPYGCDFLDAGARALAGFFETALQHLERAQ